MYRLSVAPTRAARYAVAISCNDAPLRELSAVNTPAGPLLPSLLVVAAEPHMLALRPVPPQPPSSASAHEPPAGLMPGAPWDEGWHLPPQLDEWAAAPGGLRLARAPAKAEAGVRCQLHVAMLDIFGNPCGAQGAAPSLRVVLDRPAEVP